MGLLQKKLFPNVIHEMLVRTLSTSFSKAQENVKKKEEQKQKEKRLLKVNYETLRKGEYP